MLNGSALNQAALNGAALVYVPQASGALTASAGFAAEPSLQHEGAATINCGMSVIFGGDKIVFASWPVSAGATAILPSLVRHAGVGAWVPTSTWQAYIIRVLEADAGFDASATLSAIPNAIFGEGAWECEGGAAFEPTLNGAMQGTWASTSATFESDGLVTRMVVGDWVGTAQLWSETTLESGGDVFHEGYTFWEGLLEWENILYLTATFINGSFQQANGNWNAVAKGIYAGRGVWSGSGVLNAPATLISHTSVSMSAGSAFTVTATYSGKPATALTAGGVLIAPTIIKHAARMALVAGSEIVGAPKRNGAMNLTVAPTTTLSVIGVRQVLPEFPVEVSAGFSITGKILKPASAAWSGLGSALLAGATRAASPAPAERRFVIPRVSRTFKVPVSRRTFKVAA